jgi:signal transduction histidine kinase
MTIATRLRGLPVTLRVPLVVAALMIALALVASEIVLSALGGWQSSRLAEAARIHMEGLSIALGPSVLRQDVWEVYDTLDRARAADVGQRLLLTIVADEKGRVLAATDPRRAPVGSDITTHQSGAVAPDSLKVSGDTVLRVVAPVTYLGRDVGRIVTELDVTDLLEERRKVAIWLVLGNAAATIVLTFAGWLAVARILRPVGALIEAMGGSNGAPQPMALSDISSGDPGIARLVLTYNEMAKEIEARAEMERRLAERERFVSLGRLTSSLAHEINNPLGGLLNAADTIRTYADRPDVVRRSVGILQRGLDHLREVTRAILDEYRLDRGSRRLQKEDFDDIRLLFEAEVHKRGHFLVWQLDVRNDLLASLPAAPVRQIALNLLLNAGVAAGEHGRVGLVAATDGDRLTLTVTDSGPGLASADIARLLSSSPIPPGGGVGLRLVHDTVRELAGDIGYERLDGETTVRVWLPVSPVEE